MSRQGTLFPGAEQEPHDDENECQWMRAHGAEDTVFPHEVADIKEGVAEAYRLLRDGAWRTREWIESRHSATEAMRRVRDLRPALDGLGLEVQCRRKPGAGRVFEYRIARKGTK